MNAFYPTHRSVLLLIVLYFAPLGSALGARPVLAGEYPCLIEPHVVVDLSTAVEGVLATVNVRKGDLVSQGDVVAVLESEVEDAIVEHAQVRVDSTSSIKAAEVTMARRRAKYERAVKLSSQKFASPDELNELKSALDLAQLELEAERENKRLARIELKRATSLLKRRQIRSPISGVVVQRHLNAGEFAQAQPIIRIAQLDPLNIEAVLPGVLHGTVKEGMDTEIFVTARPGLILRASVTIVEKVIDAASGTFGMRIELPNRDYKIPAGLECTVSFLSTGDPSRD